MRTTVDLTCLSCGVVFQRRLAEHRIRLRDGITKTFCSMRCAGAAKAKHIPRDEKVAAKAAYDREYRAANRAMLKAKKAAYFQRTYDPAIAADERKSRAPAHAEYIKRYYADPRRKAEKVAYDADRRASAYGEFADAHKALVALKKEVIKLCPDKYERMKARGYYERNAQQRRRDAKLGRW